MQGFARRYTVCRTWLSAPWPLLGGICGALMMAGVAVYGVWPEVPQRLAWAWHGRASDGMAQPADLVQNVARHIANGEMARAEGVYRQALVLYPYSVALHLQLAHLYALQRKHDEAEAMYLKAVALEPRAARPPQNAGELEGDAPRFQAALAAYRQASVFASMAQGSEAQLAELWLYHRQLATVAQYAETLGQRRDSREVGRTLQGRLALARQQVLEATLLFQQVLREAPHFAPAHYALGLAYLQQHNVQLATHAFATALELAPEGIELYRALAQLHMQTRAFAPALAVGERLRTVHPRQPLAHSIIGNAWLALGEPARALAALHTVTEQAPQDPRSYYELGLGYRQYHQGPEALAAFEHALALNPHWLDALLQIVDMALVQGETVKARERVVKQLQVSPHDPQLYKLLGSILFAEDERCRGNNNVHAVRKRQSV